MVLRPKNRKNHHFGGDPESYLLTYVSLQFRCTLRACPVLTYLVVIQAPWNCVLSVNSKGKSIDLPFPCVPWKMTTSIYIFTPARAFFTFFSRKIWPEAAFQGEKSPAKKYQTEIEVGWMFLKRIGEEMPIAFAKRTSISFVFHPGSLAGKQAILPLLVLCTFYKGLYEQ